MNDKDLLHFSTFGHQPVRLHNGFLMQEDIKNSTAMSPSPSPSGSLPPGITCVSAVGISILKCLYDILSKIECWLHMSRMGCLPKLLTLPLQVAVQGSSQPNTTEQVCGLSASYCCYGRNDEAVSTTIPSGDWPPSSFPIPQHLLHDDLPTNNQTRTTSTHTSALLLSSAAIMSRLLWYHEGHVL